MRVISSALWSYLIRLIQTPKVTVTLKMAVAITLLWVIYKDLNSNLSLSSWRHSGVSSIQVHRALLSVIILLAIANWTAEVIKWQVLFKWEKPFSNAYREVLVGVTAGLITPGRIGEYFGRSYMARHGSLTANLSGTFLASVCQNSINVIIGLAALYIFNESFELALWLSWSAILLVGIVSVIGAILVSIKWRSIMHWMDKVGILKVSPQIISKVLLLSLVRYIIYASQFALMFWALGSEVSLPPLLILVSIVYLIQSGLPLPPFLSALARVEIALLIFSYHVDNELLIVCSTLLIWIINVVGPALLGWVYLLKTNRH